MQLRVLTPCSESQNPGFDESALVLLCAEWMNSLYMSTATSPMAVLLQGSVLVILFSSAYQMSLTATDHVQSTFAVHSIYTPGWESTNMHTTAGTACINGQLDAKLSATG